MDHVVSCFRRKPEAAARLVCFPWAGGGSLHYGRWGSLFPGSVEVYSVRLPGREARGREPLLLSMEEVVEEVVEALLPALKEKPFAFFGHSFGALTSFAVADALRRRHGLQPLHLFLSGASAPHSQTRLSAPKRSALTDDEFLQWLSSIGGTPPELLANPEVLKLFLPALRADLHVVDTYRCDKPTAPLLSCPITCFDGRQDVPHDLQAWRDVSSGDFTVRMLEGDHFYLKDSGNEKVLIDLVTKHLETADMDYL
ncbi:unnamed protein product [Merluccius merluccius]